MIWDEALNPKQTSARIRAKQGPINKITEQVGLPLDFEPMTGEATDTVPYEAWHWFWKYNIKEEDLVKYNIGWSDRYKRVIIPLYVYAHVGEDIARKLVGWVGREVEYKSKEERRAKGVPKYRTRAKKGKRRYFVCPGRPDTVVVCEDAISAIRVNIATNFSTVALLNTTVSDDLMRWFRGKTIYLWLDGDMLASSMKQVQRMRGLGLNAKHIHTPKDPKAYNDLAIQQTLKVKNE
jgi:hypothetical protein